MINNNYVCNCIFAESSAAVEAVIATLAVLATVFGILSVVVMPITVVLSILYCKFEPKSTVSHQLLLTRCIITKVVYINWLTTKSS